MITDLSDVLGLTTAALWTGLAVFLRVGAVMAVMPVFGEQTVPLRIRLAATVAFTIVVTPAVAPLIETPTAFSPVAVLNYGIEVVVGLFLGILLRLFVLGLSIAGSMAAQATSLSQIFGGSAGAEPQPAIGHLMVIAGLALAALLGLHVRIAAMLIASYQSLPFGVALPASDVAALGVAQIARIFGFAFTLAAPFLIAATLYNVTLGVINRAMPQLMVAFVGAPVITAGGLVLLLLSLPTVLTIWVAALNGFLADPLGMPP